MPRAIHQLVAGYSKGDAISNEARVMRSLFESWGFEAAIWCEAERTLPALKKDARDLAGLPGAVKDDDIVLLHLSIGSVVNDLFPTLPGQKVILYHNITPDSFFKNLNPAIARDLAWGRDQMKQLAGTACINLADSAYNALELEELGYGPTGVLPLVLDLDNLDKEKDPSVANRFGDGRTNILFVGRCAPNKAIHDLLYAFHWYQRFFEPDSRLLHVGSASGVEAYGGLMKTVASDLELNNVHFLGPVAQSTLNSLYETSHLFLCMSEHEGFGIPLIEAMAKDLPVLAFDAAAVGDTMGGAGVLFKHKVFDEVAMMAHKLVHEHALREAVLNKQRQRISDYRNRDLEQELRTYLQPVLSGS